jgi:hypothetical protein
MPLETANSVLPMWVVLPGAIVAAFAIGSHLASLPAAKMPSSRRRIRMANGVVLLGLTALLAYALGFVGMLPEGGGSIGHIRAFVIVWMTIIGLLPLVLLLAGLDVLNTVRLQREARKRLRTQFRRDLLQEMEIRVTARLGDRGRVVGRTGGAGDDVAGH